MRYEIHGTVMQSVDVYLSRGAAVFTEAGGMAWMAGAIEMKTDTRGGVLAGLGRKLAGESLFMTTYSCTGDQGLVVFTPEAPEAAAIPQRTVRISMGPNTEISIIEPSIAEPRRSFVFAMIGSAFPELASSAATRTRENLPRSGPS